MLYFEDIEPGTKSSFGRYEVTRDEVIEFATKYDPQPFHLSDEEAAKTHFGKLAASGWHTTAMMMRMLGWDPPASTNCAGLRLFIPATSSVLKPKSSTSVPRAAAPTWDRFARRRRCSIRTILS
jgi:acyl dehydratase